MTKPRVCWRLVDAVTLQSSVAESIIIQLRSLLCFCVAAHVALKVTQIGSLVFPTSLQSPANQLLLAAGRTPQASLRHTKQYAVLRPT